MFLSKHKNGRYYIYYDTPEGTRKSISTKSKLKSEALKFLSNFEAEQKQRLLNKVIPISIKDFTFQFLKYSETLHSIKTTKSYRTTLNYLTDFLGNVNLFEITTKDINRYLENRINESSIFQGRKDLINLSSAFNKAIADGYLNDNPCGGIKRIKVPEKQPLFYSEIEFQLLLDKIDNQDIKDLVIVAVNTGLRQAELLTLQWNQIDFRNRLIILDNQNHLTKSRKIRTVPLNIKALQALTEREINKSCNYVFTLNNEPINQDYLVHKFKKYVIAAKINLKLNFHSLRHTFASWLVQKGVPIYTVSKLLGHSNIKTTEIYAHLQTETLRISVNVLDEPHNLTQELIR